MPGAEKLREKIIAQASEQADQVLNEARLRAEKIIAKAEQDAASRKNTILEKGRAQAEERGRRILTIAELDARKNVLTAKQELIEETFVEALARLQKMGKAKYQELIFPMLIDAVNSGQEEIIISPRDESNFTAEFLAKVNEAITKKGIEGKLIIAEEKREMQGGFILRAGDVEINSSFDSILRMMRDQLEPEIAAILFSE